MDFASRYILEELGVSIEAPDAVFLDKYIEPYIEKGFPTTKEFSALARKIYINGNPIDNPDYTLVKWMEQEEKLFKRLEHHLVKEKLENELNGEIEVQKYTDFFLGVHNRRKARAGHSLENHLQEILNENKIEYSKGKITENKSRPDFLFPNIELYHSQSFPDDKLTMLGVKSTCKDRWRQVLAEADKINLKHLLTLEPAITSTQTHEMQSQNLQLVLPAPIHQTYKPEQREWLMDLVDFIELIKEREKFMGKNQ